MLTSSVNPTQQFNRRRSIAGPTVRDDTSLDASDYTIAVEPQQAAACLRVRDELRRRNARLDSIEPSDFQEPALAGIGRGILRRIRSGPGFCLLRGLPFAGWTDEEASMLYWGLGT